MSMPPEDKSALYVIAGEVHYWHEGMTCSHWRRYTGPLPAREIRTEEVRHAERE